MVRMTKETSSKLNYGYLLIRLGIGLYFLRHGFALFSENEPKLLPIVILLAGALFLVGIFVRPAAIAVVIMLFLLCWSGDSLHLSIMGRYLPYILMASGVFMFGGGFLALGEGIGALRGKWYQ